MPALCAEWQSALNELFWRRVEECRESREPVVHIIIGQQVNASHTTSSVIVWGGCDVHIAVGRSSISTGQDNWGEKLIENKIENKLFFSTTYYFTHTHKPIIAWKIQLNWNGHALILNDFFLKQSLKLMLRKSNKLNKSPIPLFILKRSLICIRKNTWTASQ